MNHGIDYWREMRLDVPTHEFVIKNNNYPVKFEAAVMASSLILPEDKILPSDDFEPSLLELRLQVPESGLLFRAYFIVAQYISSVGNIFTSKGNLEAAAWLNGQIRSGKSSMGVFGGKISFAELFMGRSEYVNIQLGYAEFPKDSGIAYVFDWSAPLANPSKF